ncbi:uncharacterized protein M6B38_375480 [Iris pallida]|uniref:J domain-containing protein n=1 Tax=Iris pallida TaxID=29817 RepID=A0AAX6GC34_IRIPA|nr:uncharacterized protein M6B38_375480 [Iris pallida]
MECNREEALRAKEIAERKFMAKDIGGAKKFALKAHNLFPSLDGINQMIATLDVYLSSGARPDGEKDWYAVLSVNSSADDETLKKQYRKLALQLHPDKNKSVGAEGAFQLLSEAWSVLSDKSRRMLYDHRRKLLQPMMPPSKKDHSASKTSNGFCSFASNTTSRVRAQKTNSGMPPPSSSSINSRKPPPPSSSTSRFMPPPSTSATNSGMPPPPSSSINSGVVPPSSSSFPPSSQRSDSKTFWTLCKHCKVRYEYLRVYMGRNLLCPNCHQPFLADGTEVSTSTYQSKVNGASMGSSGLQHGGNPDLYNSSSFQWSPFSRTAGAASANASSTAASQAANVVHQTYEKVRRERQEAKAVARREALRKRSQGLKRNTSGHGKLSAGLDNNEHTIPKVSHPKRKGGTIEDCWANYGRQKIEIGFDSGKIFMSQINSRQFNLKRGFPQVHVHNILMGKSKNEVLKTLEKWNSAAAAKSAKKENAKKKLRWKESATERVKEVRVSDTIQVNKMDELKSNVKQASAKKDLSVDQTADSDKKMIEAVKLDVPDPDFHDFDKDRTEKSFNADEIWATYDDEDGMPRYYALIQKLISLKPFKVRMSFLNSKSNSEFGPLNWVASGFAKTCGEFRVGKYEVRDAPNAFSHKVKWEKGPRGIIKVVPKKGDIWAIYRNWSPDWNEHTPDEVIYKYDMVEVLEDYKEEQGVSIVPLVKVAGFRTVFHRHMDPEEIKRIRREEMFRFSHQVPFYVLTGEEGCKAPKGCYELDPASTPVELLQIVPERKDDEEMQASEHLQEQAVG